MTWPAWKEALFWAMVKGYALLFGWFVGSILGEKFPPGWRKERSARRG